MLGAIVLGAGHRLVPIGPIGQGLPTPFSGDAPRSSRRFPASAPPSTPRAPATRRRDGDVAPAAPRPGLRAVSPLARVTARNEESLPSSRLHGRLPQPTGGVHLSPFMTAVFGGMFGLATLTSIIAVLIQVFPPSNDSGQNGGNRRERRQR